MAKWKTSFAASLLINFALFAGAAAYMQYAAPEPDAKPEPVELAFITEVGESEKSPKIAAPKPQKVEIPTPPTPEQVKQMTDGVPVEEVLKDINKTQPTNPTSNQPTNNSNTPSDASNTGPGGPGKDETGVDTPGQPGQDEKRETPVGETHGAQLLSQPQPEFPADLQKRGVQGRVTVRVVVDESGNVADVSVVSSDNSELDQYAIAAAYQASFKPAMENGVPISTAGNLRYGFGY